MKKFSVFLCSIMLVFGMAATVSAVPVEVTFTGDNFITSWSVDGSAQVGSLSNPDNWSETDTVSLDLGLGGHEIIWNVEDLNDGWDIVAFLGQIASDGDILTSSNAWDIMYEDSGWMSAAELYPNGAGPWAQNGISFPEIDASAFWIWAPTDGYVPKAEIRAQFNVGSLEYNPVPEPATMLLLGTGLIGFAALGRKRFLKK